jgi:hypothetical protein
LCYIVDAIHAVDEHYPETIVRQAHNACGTQSTGSAGYKSYS